MFGGVVGKRTEPGVIASAALGGHAFRVGDCYVWAQIDYLDSPTDYKEALQEQSRGQCSTAPRLSQVLGSISLRLKRLLGW